MRKKLIYIAMPYTAETPERIARNIENARRFVRENFPSDSEFFPVIPHNTGIGVEGLGGESYWYDATESLMQACSAVVLGPRWRSSRGARSEFEAAQRGGIPVIEAQLVGDRLVERLRAVTEPGKSEQTLEPAHWQRVRDERWQLSERIIKLRSFLGSAAAFPAHETTVLSEQTRLLEKQLDVMLEYQNLLDTRLQRATR